MAQPALRATTPGWVFYRIVSKRTMLAVRTTGMSHLQRSTGTASPIATVPSSKTGKVCDTQAWSPEFDPHHLHKNPGMMVNTCNPISRVSWLVSLANHWVPAPNDRHLLPQKRGTTSEKNTQGWPLTSIQRHIHIYYMYAAKHTNAHNIDKNKIYSHAIWAKYSIKMLSANDSLTND